MALVLVLLTTVLACVLIYRRLKFVQCFNGFPGVRAWPIIGNTLNLLGSQADFLHLLITEGKKNENGTLCLWVGMRPFVFLHKAEVIKPLVTSNRHTEKNFEYTLVKDWLGEGLITSKGSKWVKHRQLLTPCFNFDLLKVFPQVIWKQTLVFIDQLRINSTAGEEIIIFPLAKRLALDLICETALGTSVNAQMNLDSDYVLAIERLADIVCRRFITPVLKPNLIFKNTPLGREQKKLLKIIHGFVEKVIAERKNMKNNNMETNKQFACKKYTKEIKSTLDDGTKNALDLNHHDLSIGNYSNEYNNSTEVKNEMCRIRKELVNEYEEETNDVSNGNLQKRRNFTLLDLLLEIAEKDNTISERDIVDEVNTFMFAGHDTASSALAFTLFVLGHNPSWQEKIVEEINLLCPDICDRYPTYETVKKFDVLNRVIKESLRLYPVAPLVGRTITTPLQTPAGVLVPGTTAVMNIFLLHRDTNVFTQPDKFDPDRFLPHNLHTNPYAYIPFSAGPRNCIGQKLALLELKIVIAMTLIKFEIKSVQKEEDLQLSFEIVLFTNNEMKLVFKERSQKP